MPLELTLIGMAIILALSVFAGKLQWQVHTKNKQAAAKQARLDESRKEQREKMLSSLHIIARAYLSGQAELAEASLRIHHLLNYLDVDGEQRETFVAFDKVASALAHIPIREDWKALNKSERAAYRKTIERMESEFADFAKNSALALATLELK